MSESKQIAVACEGPEGLGGNVSGHFGHTPYFVVAVIEGSQVVSTKVVPSPGHGEGCSMPEFIQRLGAQAIVVGGLGGGAARGLSALGIEVIGGIFGNAGQALRALAEGSLAKGDARCSGHDGGGCNHH